MKIQIPSIQLLLRNDNATKFDFQRERGDICEYNS